MRQQSIGIKKQHLSKPLIATLLLFFSILFGLCYGISKLNTVSEEQQFKVAQKAVVRAAVECYALEGSYPKNLSYLKENYSLMVDEEQYIVDYCWIGSNLMPDITILSKNTSFMEESNNE